MTMADRVAVLRDGVLQQCAAPRELYTRPIFNQSVSLGDWIIPVPHRIADTAAEVIVGIRPNTSTSMASASKSRSTWWKKLGSDAYSVTIGFSARPMRSE